MQKFVVKKLSFLLADSKVKVVVIPTDEELLIASDTMDILKK